MKDEMDPVELKTLMHLARLTSRELAALLQIDDGGVKVRQWTKGKAKPSVIQARQVRLFCELFKAKRRATETVIFHNDHLGDTVATFAGHEVGRFSAGLKEMATSEIELQKAMDQWAKGLRQSPDTIRPHIDQESQGA